MSGLGLKRDRDKRRKWKSIAANSKRKAERIVSNQSIVIWRLEVTRILKYLSGRDWGSDASTLRITYTTLVCPVLEYGYQIFHVASPANLKKLERVQLSAARIITGLRYCCPTDVVLYEADIQPFTMRFEVNSYRYFNKIKSFGSFNRTSSFILNWTSNQRLKRDRPLNDMYKRGFIDCNVDPSAPFSCITPIDSLNHVEFREELLTSTPKHSSRPELLRQLALEVMNDIPDQALVIYTDGSRSDTGRAGSGIFSNIPGTDVKIRIRNPDHYSVFCSELIAISGALDHALNSYTDNSTALDILSKLVKLGQRKQVCLQWIPPHVGVPGNEAADELAGRGRGLSNPSSTILRHSEIHSLQRTKMNLTWRIPPAHHWYEAKSPGLSLQCRSSRAHQTALTRFGSGHLRSMTFVHLSLLVSALSLLLLLIFWTSEAFPCYSCMKSKTWCVTLLCGKVK
ncbi:RNase H domain-containing protein [Trichonephila clavipes]|nr:RNase H domain-containing protein [Trichonephila clavipes]